MPSFDDIIARLEALEAKGVGPSLQDLPLTALRNWLEQNWRPGAQSLIEPGSITIDLLDAAIKIGRDTVTWPGGSQDSVNTSVLHGFDRAPRVFLQSLTITAHARPASIGNSSFTAAMRTIDGSLPPAATAADFFWMAFSA